MKRLNVIVCESVQFPLSKLFSLLMYSVSDCLKHFLVTAMFKGEAVSTLVGHTQCVSSVVWPQRETIYSASWDHSVRKWDAETGKDLSDIVSMPTC